MPNEKEAAERTTSENYARAAARLLESVSKTAQLSSWATPEIHEMFEGWLDILGRQILRDQQLPGRIDVTSKADEIGISRSSLVSLLLFLQRQGKISITDMGLEAGEGSDEEICNCMKGK